MKTELLAPAGNLEILKSAIEAGADAIYIGGKKFGARAFAPNFTNEEIKQACNLCHLYDVKLYVTINTVVFENEILDFIDFVKFLYEIGIDAVIVQDIGMINIIKKLFPRLEIHSSTQMHTHNNYCVKLLKSMGISRVVLAREMSLKEIKKLDKNIEIEVFIHGALCASYSGCCLFSSLNGGRSGNRGACVGSCRLPYKIIKNGKIIKTDDYVLSTKDLCSVHNIKELLDSNINSFKIEGRMKNLHYVKYVTYVYRKLIDDYYADKKIDVPEETINNLKKLFNREFTKGYLFEDNIYNSKSPNHIGTFLGKVVKFNKNKIYIKLHDTLYQEDGIRFTNSKKGMIVNKIYNEKGLLVNKVDKNSICIIDNKIGLDCNDLVNKTIDMNLIKLVEEIKGKKIAIKFEVKAKINEPLIITISDGKNKITENFSVLEKAINKSTSKQEIFNKLNKLGNTPFYLDSINYDLDKVFIPMTILNEARRILCEKLISARTNFLRTSNVSYVSDFPVKNKRDINVLVRNEKQLKFVLGKVDKIYVTDYELYKAYKNKNIFYKVPRINYEDLNFENENLLVSDLGALYKFSKQNNVITDYTLNVCNHESINTLSSFGSKQITLSPEITEYNICNYNTETIVYGRLELMAIKHLNYSGDYLVDKFENKYPIINDHYTSILHFKNFDIIDKNIKGNLRIELFDEDEKQISKILERLKC